MFGEQSEPNGKRISGVSASKRGQPSFHRESRVINRSLSASRPHFRRDLAENVAIMPQKGRSRLPEAPLPIAAMLSSIPDEPKKLGWSLCLSRIPEGTKCNLKEKK